MGGTNPYFLVGRQFFGLLVPGVLWSVAILLLLDPHLLLRDSYPWTVTAAFFAASYLAGRSLAGLSAEATGWFIHSLIPRCRHRFCLWRKNDLKRCRRARALEHWVRKAVEHHHPDDPYAMDAAQCPKASKTKGKPWERSNSLFVWCKLVMLDRPSGLAGVLEVLEAEINLLRHLPLPLAASAIALFVACWCHGHVDRYVLTACPALLAVAFLLTLRLRRSLLSETTNVYEMFLVTRGGTSARDA